MCVYDQQHCVVVLLYILLSKSQEDIEGFIQFLNNRLLT